MSANNYLGIWRYVFPVNKEMGIASFWGYNLDAETETDLTDIILLKNKFTVYKARNMEEAIIKAEKFCQNNEVEYGYRFLNIVSDNPTAVAKEWRPADWKNPYEEYKETIFNASGYPTFEAGASVMLKAIRELDIEGAALHKLHETEENDIINGTIVFIPNDGE